MSELGRRLGTEACGTFAWIVGSACLLAAPNAATPLLVGLLLGTLIAFIGADQASFNPALAVALAGAGHGRPRRLLPVLVIQAAAAGAAFALVALLGIAPAATIAASPEVAFAVETLASGLVAFVYLVATDIGLTAAGKGILTGGAASLACLFAQPLSGALLNPLRGLPALLANDPGAALVAVAGPFAGATLGLAVALAVRQSTLQRVTRYLQREAMAG